jgi:hypothetical protein
LAAVPHVNSIEQQGQRGGVEAELAVFHIGGFGPGKRAAFKTFG